MDETNATGRSGISRRQALKLGTAIGGVVWTAPTVIALTISPAAAAQPSGWPGDVPDGGRDRVVPPTRGS